jgi:hypothetical protein
MPAKSEKQRKLMAIAEHHPEQLNTENRGVLKMSHQQLHDFASTKGAPTKAPKPAKGDSETHAFDFRKQKGKRAPLMMKSK